MTIAALVLWGIMVTVGAWLARRRDWPVWVGVVLSAAFGPLGWLILAVSNPHRAGPVLTDDALIRFAWYVVAVGSVAAMFAAWVSWQSLRA